MGDSFIGNLTESVNQLTPTSIAISVAVLLGSLITIWLQNGPSTPKELRNLRREGVSSSNMSDQTDSKYDFPESTENDGPIRIKAIFVHPIKSCAPVELNRAQLIKSGLVWDRCFALATEVNRAISEGGPIWRFISQRTKPLMSQIKTELWLRPEGSDASSPFDSVGCLVFKFPDPDPPTLLEQLKSMLFSHPREVSAFVSLSPDENYLNKHGIAMKTFAIHSREAKGLDMGNAPTIAATLPKLKRFLNIPEHQKLTLLRCTPNTLVPTEKNLAPLEHIGKPAVHGYTDQQPVNVNNLASVHAVSALLPKENQPLNALRFRANIWITGAPAFIEETWKRYRVVPKQQHAASPSLSVVCRTSRCTLPNVNPLTGKFDTDKPDSGKTRGNAQPSSTLVKHRTVEDGNPRALGYLGMHCVPENAGLQQAADSVENLYVQVGDEIEVLERGVHLYGSTANDY
ncbi:Mitochondrial amidoxime reducing component 2 [Fusarium oxysporum f. sp. cubense]|uniref:Mitochondrial amidoxime reducing component 2 n=1 Tax=Fusarium oxysporum f. sp. cubense TaxID=61366 RepID=A0A559LN34_FUSOC|nr:Mitochondrial amidoxime reducing component 2 [Fusarium oxysporum f. sp. cubense]